MPKTERLFFDHANEAVIPGLSKSETAELNDAHEMLGRFLTMDSKGLPQQFRSYYFSDWEVLGERVLNQINALMHKVEDPTKTIELAGRVVEATELYLPLRKSDRERGVNRRENHIAQRLKISMKAMDALFAAIPELPTPTEKVLACLNASYITHEFVDNTFLHSSYDDKAIGEAKRAISGMSEEDQASIIINAFKSFDADAPRKSRGFYPTWALKVISSMVVYGENDELTLEQLEELRKDTKGAKESSAMGYMRSEIVESISSRKKMAGKMRRPQPRTAKAGTLHS